MAQASNQQQQQGRTFAPGRFSAEGKPCARKLFGTVPRDELERFFAEQQQVREVSEPAPPHARRIARFSLRRSPLLAYVQALLEQGRQRPVKIEDGPSDMVSHMGNIRCLADIQPLEHLER